MLSGKDAAMGYSPLRPATASEIAEVDRANTEKRNRLWNRLYRTCGLVWWEESANRMAVRAQLLARREYPSWQWQGTPLEPDLTERILKLIKATYEWPNHHFIPNDPMGLVLQEGTNDFADAEFFADAYDLLGRPRGVSSWCGKLCEESPLIELIRLLAAPDRASERNGGSVTYLL